MIDRERGGGRCWDSNNREVLRIWVGGACLIWDSKIEVLVGGGGGVGLEVSRCELLERLDLGGS